MRKVDAHVKARSQNLCGKNARDGQKNSILLTEITFGVSSVSFGAFVSGHALLAHSVECDRSRTEQASEASALSCDIGRSYVMGVFDMAHSLTERWLFEKRFCKPDDVDRQQLLFTVRKFMDDHPEQMDFAAAGIVYDALTQAYPCE